MSLRILRDFDSFQNAQRTYRSVQENSGVGRARGRFQVQQDRWERVERLSCCMRAVPHDGEDFDDTRPGDDAQTVLGTLAYLSRTRSKMSGIAYPLPLTRKLPSPSGQTGSRQRVANIPIAVRRFTYECAYRRMYARTQVSTPGNEYDPRVGSTSARGSGSSTAHRPLDGPGLTLSMDWFAAVDRPLRSSCDAASSSAGPMEARTPMSNASPRK